MSKTNVRLAAGFLTFILGVTLASLWFKGRLYQFGQGVTSTNKDADFKLTLEHEGPYSHYYDYESPGGEKLMCGCIRFSSADRASAELRRRIDFRPNLTEILEEGGKVDGEGQDVGERIVAIETGLEKGRLAHVLWTRGEELCWIDSPSLQQALALEKQSRF